jgi:hypothetical protein
MRERILGQFFDEFIKVLTIEAVRLCFWSQWYDIKLPNGMIIKKNNS